MRGGYTGTSITARGPLLFRLYIASIRLAFALVCVGIGLLLTGQWLGFFPDLDGERIQAKQNYCEAVAIHVAGAVRRQQWSDLETSLQTLVDHHDDLLSIGIRNEYGHLRSESGHHDAFWFADPWRALQQETRSSTDPFQIDRGNQAAGALAAAQNTGDVRSDARPDESSDDRNRSSNIDSKSGEKGAAITHTVEVPITMNRRHWGTVELAFAGDHSSLFSGVTNHSLFPLVCYFAIAGLFSYSVLMARVMGVFKSTQVVPDRVREALNTLAEGLLVLDDRARIVLANRAFLGSTGAGEEDTRGRCVDDLPWILDAEAPEDWKPWQRSIDNAEIASGTIQRYRMADNEVRVFSVNSAPIGGDADNRGALVTFRDVTHIEAHRSEQEKMLSMLRNSRDEIHRKNRELEVLATQDSLTHCLNRRAFFERFETLWNAAKADGGHLSCLMFDNDHFKSVNDNYGHHVGDDVLRQVAKTIRDHHEARHLVCRYGGEEFCVVLPHCDLETAIEEAEKTRRAIMAIRFKEPAELRLTASIGVSDLSFDAADPQTLINQADACLYIAKERGRNRVVAYDPSFEDRESAEAATSQRVDAHGPPSDDMVAMPFQAVTALLGALSYRDRDTAEHSCRVSELCVRAAQGLMDQREIYCLEVAALLHDIGKIGVPDHVLLKPGKLTDEEWDLMGQHDKIGVDIIEGTFGSPALSDIIRNHHAFFGGGGRHRDLPYGEQIPLGARIMTIADSYDAMVSDRVYRKGWSHEEAIEELRRCADTQFDPELVEAFAAKIIPGETPISICNDGLSKQTALRIGVQIERIAYAMDRRDPDQLKSLAIKLGTLARSQDIESIALTAESIEQRANESIERTAKDVNRGLSIAASFEDVIGDGVDEGDEQWIELLRDTNKLLDLCRATQNVYLGDTTQRNRAVIEAFQAETEV